MGRSACELAAACGMHIVCTAVGASGQPLARSSGALLRLTVLRASLCSWAGAAGAGTAGGAAGSGATTPQQQRQFADTDTQLNFGPAWPGDEYVFGSRRPGYPSHQVNTSAPADVRARRPQRLCGEGNLQAYTDPAVRGVVRSGSCASTPRTPHRNLPHRDIPERVSVAAGTGCLSRTSPWCVF